jgi:ATP-dependent DNA helicase RecG
VSVDGSIRLDTAVRFLRGVGPVRAEQLARLGISTVGDLVYHLPSRHEELPVSKPIGDLVLDEVASVVGEVTRVSQGGQGRSGSVTATVEDATGRCQVKWFHSPFVAQRVHRGGFIRLTGKVSQYRDWASFANPKYAVFETSGEAMACDAAVFEPVYPATGSTPSRQIGRLIQETLSCIVAQISEYLPEELRRARQMPPLSTAIERIHRPTSAGDVPVARRRLAYDELLLLQLAVQSRRHLARTSEQADPLPVSAEIDQRIRARFPFHLTPGQAQAVGEIVADLAGQRPMRRMVQADVGAGKTAVALYAALAAIANRRQVAMLAPTEVLARQHFEKVSGYLRGSRVRLGCLLGATPAAERRTLLAEAGRGRLNLLVGTHAILGEQVKLPALGLVIVDEQHRFGVSQRAVLARSGVEKTGDTARHECRGSGVPHYLLMTATPIPRTLAMTVFGDLDVSIIRDGPAGRGAVRTRLMRSDQESEAWEQVRRRVAAGERAFVVCPVVEESQDGSLRSAVVERDRLCRSELAGLAVGLLHGQMKAETKREVMDAFRRGEVSVLVTTTVVEVGLDVPEATVMVILHADRYGLSQLHQLRGRIGRGSRESQCVLVSDAFGAAAMERLGTLVETNDGFAIAEKDLLLRGPGELIGTRQHGVPVLKAANLMEDADLVALARGDAHAILSVDPALGRAEHRALRREMLARFGAHLALVDVA